MGRIRIVVVDDHEVVRHGVCRALEDEADMEIVGEARSGADAVRLAGETRPDVMLLDVRLEDVDGPEVCRQVLAIAPKTAVVMLTSYLQDNAMLRSLTAGARGYVIKDVELEELRRTIRSVHRGHSVLDPKIAARVIASVTSGNGKATSHTPSTFSEVDLAIIKHVARGLTNREIASHVNLSTHTVKDRLEKIGVALDVRSRTEIVAEALRAGLI